MQVAFISRMFWSVLVFATAASAQIYSQQAGKLVGAGAINKQQVPTNAIGVSQGWVVALSGDGNTALVGGPSDNGGVGAVWVFVRQNGVAWRQQRSDLEWLLSDFRLPSKNCRVSSGNCSIGCCTASRSTGSGRPESAIRNSERKLTLPSRANSPYNRPA